MAFRIYVVPMTTTVRNGRTFRTAKYFQDGTIPAPTLTVLSYGAEPWCFVGADLPAADDATVVSQPDVNALPFDLNPHLTQNEVNGVKNFLEAANIAANWVSTADTWLGVFRSVAGMFMFWQAYEVLYVQANGGQAPSVFAGGVTLNTTFGSLPVLVQNAMIAAAQNQKIPTTGLTASVQLRAIEKNMADFYAGQKYQFGDRTI